MFGVIYADDACDPEALLDVARGFSPRLEPGGSDREIVLDLSGLTRLFGDPQTLAEELGRTAAARGLRIRVAIAGTRTAASLAVRYRAGLTVIAPGHEAEALAPLPIGALAAVPPGHGPDVPGDPDDLVRTLRRWGLRTLGALAALPVDEVAARLGQAGVRLHRASRGHDGRPLVPQVPDERFEEALDLDWPIDGLEPLSFVLGRLLDPLSARLERRGRGAAVLRVRLHLVTRAVHERSQQLPVPMREARALRTLLLLDLESHPPPAAIDRVEVAVEPTPARVVQGSLLARPLPPPEQIATLMARLQALMGETRCGAPAVVDAWQPGAFAMTPFAPVDAGDACRPGGGIDAAIAPVMALRRFRVPLVAQVRVEDGAPVRVATGVAGLPGGRVETAAGPWRTSGAWWLEPPETGAVTRRWDRDEWDVTLTGGATCRIFRARDTGQWFLEAVVD